MLGRLLRAPLLQFVVVGLGLFLLVRTFAPERNVDPARAPASARTIEVRRDALLDYVQLRTGAADAAGLAARWDGLSAADRRVWIDRFVREEALVREARRLGLDRDDDLIRRRLVQQMEFLVAGEEWVRPSDEEIEALYLERVDEHVRPRMLSFAHVFVAEVRAAQTAREQGPAAARMSAAYARAATLRDELNRENASFEWSGGRGDRFLYNRAYVDRTEDEVRAHFGEALAAAVGALEPDGDRWQGPLSSDHGWHLVLLIRNDPPEKPGLEAIRSVLIEEERRRWVEARREAGVAEILERFEVRIQTAPAPARPE